MTTEAQQIQELKARGYTDADIQQAMNEVDSESELQQSYQQAQYQQQQDPRQFSSNTFVAGMTPQNIIEWQLELDSILERVEHLLRGDRPTFRKGSIVYIAPENEEDYILNEYGVSEVMRCLTLYINRNTILSNYDEDTINYKVYDFGCDLADLFFLKYDEYGMTTAQKRKQYPMLVRQLVDIVHSAYLRALNGGEREALRKAINVSQNLNNDPQQMQQMGMQRQERSILNPMRLFKGKYV